MVSVTRYQSSAVPSGRTRPLGRKTQKIWNNNSKSIPRKLGFNASQPVATNTRARFPDSACLVYHPILDYDALCIGRRNRIGEIEVVAGFDDREIHVCRALIRDNAFHPSNRKTSARACTLTRLVCMQSSPQHRISHNRVTAL